MEHPAGFRKRREGRTGVPHAAGGVGEGLSECGRRSVSLGRAVGCWEREVWQARKAEKRKAEKEAMQVRVEAEMDEIMDNGVRPH